MSSGFPLTAHRQLDLAAEVRDRLCCGILVLEDVQVTQGTGAARQTAETAARLRGQYQGLTPSAISGLAPARNLYKSFGMDPSRHRPSSEALLRRVLKDQELYLINSAVDSCNLASLDFLLPVGMYDLEKIQGDVAICIGEPGDSYAGIRKGQVNVGGRLSLYDAEGPFGSPTSDSLRTCVDGSTNRILAVIFAPAGYVLSDMARNLDHFAALFEAYCSAEAAAKCCLGWEA